MTSVWLLLMIILTPVSGISSTTLLNTFDSKEECVIEKERISGDMSKSYPGDKTFGIECRETHPAQITRLEIEDIAKTFARERFPKATPLQVGIMSADHIKNVHGDSSIISLELYIEYGKTPKKAESFSLFIKDKGVMGWIDEGPVEVEDAESNSTKDQA